MPPKQKSPKPAAPVPAKPPNRVAIILTGIVLGAIWGTVMWGIFELSGQDSGLRGWAYLTITIAMLGAGVAAFFGSGSPRASSAAAAADPPLNLARARRVDYPPSVTVLGGELAVPCTRNPLQRGVIPVRGADPRGRFRAEQH